MAPETAAPIRAILTEAMPPEGTIHRHIVDDLKRT